MSNYLQEFANKHGIVLTKKGEVGFGRPCVGFTHGGNYVAHNPYTHGGNYEPIKEFEDERLYAPDEVDAYHKHTCLAVLCKDSDEGYEEGLKQLEIWIRHLESLGEIEFVSYETGATGMQAMLSGFTGMAIKIKEST